MIESKRKYLPDCPAGGKRTQIPFVYVDLKKCVPIPPSSYIRSPVMLLCNVFDGRFLPTCFAEHVTVVEGEVEPSVPKAGRRLELVQWLAAWDGYSRKAVFLGIGASILHLHLVGMR